MIYIRFNASGVEYEETEVNLFIYPYDWEFESK